MAGEKASYSKIIEDAIAYYAKSINEAQNPGNHRKPSVEQAWQGIIEYIKKKRNDPLPPRRNTRERTHRGNHSSKGKRQENNKKMAKHTTRTKIHRTHSGNRAKTHIQGKEIDNTKFGETTLFFKSIHF